MTLNDLFLTKFPSAGQIFLIWHLRASACGSWNSCSCFTHQTDLFQIKNNTKCADWPSNTLYEQKNKKRNSGNISICSIFGPTNRRSFWPEPSLFSMLLGGGVCPFDWQLGWPRPCMGHHQHGKLRLRRLFDVAWGFWIDPAEDPLDPAASASRPLANIAPPSRWRPHANMQEETLKPRLIHIYRKRSR